MKECKCHSSNGDIKETGGIKEVVLYNSLYKKDICIDACIAKTIKALWEGCIETLGSCCGHGGRIKHFTDDSSPSIVVPTGMPTIKLEKARKIIGETDDRCWKIYQWQLTELRGAIPIFKVGEEVWFIKQSDPMLCHEDAYLYEGTIIEDEGKPIYRIKLTNREGWGFGWGDKMFPHTEEGKVRALVKINELMGKVNNVS